MEKETAKTTSKKTSVSAIVADSDVKSGSCDSLYNFEEFVENPGVLGACADIVSAALTEKGIKEATISEAMSVVKEFKERKVQ